MSRPNRARLYLRTETAWPTCGRMRHTRQLRRSGHSRTGRRLCGLGIPLHADHCMSEKDHTAEKASRAQLLTECNEQKGPVDLSPPSDQAARRAAHRIQQKYSECTVFTECHFSFQSPLGSAQRPLALDRGCARDWHASTGTPGLIKKTHIHTARTPQGNLTRTRAF